MKVEHKFNKIRSCLDNPEHDLYIDGNVIICHTCNHMIFREDIE